MHPSHRIPLVGAAEPRHQGWRANIKSVLERLALPGDAHALHIRHHPKLRRLPIWRLCFDPGPLGPPDGNYVECLAWRWRLGVGRLASLCVACRLVRYEDFLSDKEETLAAMAHSAGANLTADLDGQYQPPSRHSVAVEAFFGPDNLARIEDILRRQDGPVRLSRIVGRAHQGRPPWGRPRDDPIRGSHRQPATRAGR